MKSPWVWAMTVALLIASCNGNLLNDPDFDQEITPPGTTMTEILLRSIWLVGGVSGSNYATPISEIDCFDPVTGTWYPSVTSLPTPVSFAGVAGVNGKLYVFGGFDASGNVQIAVHIYDVATQTWSLGSTTGWAARACLDATHFNGDIYLFGGVTGNATVNWAAPAVGASHYAYSIAGNSWANKTGQAARSDVCGLVYGGNIHYLGGRSAAATCATTHEAYLPLSNALSGNTETVLPVGRSGMLSVLYTTGAGAPYIITAGGVTGTITGVTGCFPIYGTSVTACNPTSLVKYIAAPFSEGPAWTSGSTPLPQALAFADGVVCLNRLYIFGGTNSANTASPASGSTNAFYADLSSFPVISWTNIPDMPPGRGRYGHQAVLID